MAQVRSRAFSTPQPNLLGFKVIIPQEVVAQNPSAMPLEGSTLKTLGITGSPTSKSLGWLPDPALCADNRFGLYLYTQQGMEGTDIVFNYAYPKTVAEANVPYHTSNWKGNHRWPPVLLGVAVIADYGSPRSFTVLSGTTLGTGIGPSYYDQVQYIPDVSEGTRFVKDEFFGPISFNIPQTPVPVATSVSYLLPGGITGNFPECLHDTIKIPSALTCLEQLVSGSVTKIGSSIGEQVFPATNFTDWSPYVLSDTQEQQDGGWYRVRIRVFPPPQPESILSFN